MSQIYTLSQLAEALGLFLQGDPDLEIVGVNTLEEAGPAELSFLANPKYLPLLSQTRAGAVIVRPEFAGELKNALTCADPYLNFARAIHLFAKTQGSFSGISPLASIHPEATLGQNCTIYPFVYIGARANIGNNCVIFPNCYIGEDSRLGQDCTLYPNSVLMSETVLGQGCVLQPGAVIGAEGFGFVRTDQGIQKIPQIGHVELQDKVEIGANSTVDRAALSMTKIGKGTCIDNLVQIGHNVKIGQDNLIVAQVGIAGSTKTGNNVTIAGQTGLAGHLTVGDNVTIGPLSGVQKDLESNQIVGGIPAVDQNTYLRTLALMPRLPELFKRMTKVEKLLAPALPNE